MTSELKSVQHEKMDAYGQDARDLTLSSRPHTHHAMLQVYPPLNQFRGIASPLCATFRYAVTPPPHVSDDLILIPSFLSSLFTFSLRFLLFASLFLAHLFCLKYEPTNYHLSHKSNIKLFYKKGYFLNGKFKYHAI
jgi:hypothetical protein